MSEAGPNPISIGSPAARAAEAIMPQILHRPGGVRGPCVRAREPVAELMRRVARRRAVERHQRGRHAGNADDVRAPPILRDRDDLDQIGASCNGFFKAMNGGGHRCRRETLTAWERDELYASARCNQAKRPTKAHAQARPAGFQLQIVEKKFGCRLLHRKCTNHQQDFHSPAACRRIRVPCYP